MLDHRLVKLGKKARKYDRRTLRLARYLTPALPPPPASVDNTQGVAAWGMMLNDQLGDCTIAGCGHAVQIWTLSAGSEVTLPDSTILEYYETFDGYNPSDPSTDQGGIELDVLKDWKNQGLAGYPLSAYVSVDPQDTSHVASAIELFGGLYIGLLLPLSAQNQSPWDYVPDGSAGDPTPGSWGGHCVFVVGYDQEGLTCITWGQLQKMSFDFWEQYCDEAYALLSPNWQPPAGFDMPTLQADLQLVTG